jgi:8-oxo-dGTP pyrophosphatase MutT (NUDIX family)
VITVVAALVTDAAGRLLLVRKRGTDRFMQPGGKPEAGETLREALARELAEELRLTVSPDAFAALGRFEADAANEPGHALVAHVFRLEAAEPVRAAAEIDEVRWCTVAEADALGARLAPLARTLLALC